MYEQTPKMYEQTPKMYEETPKMYEQTPKIYEQTPKLRPQLKKQEEVEKGCCTIRCWLLVWAFLRLIVSVLWTGVIIIDTAVYLRKLQHRPNEVMAPSYEQIRLRLWFDVFAVLAQLVEFGMLITFITAGIKKSVSLYRAYYRYCIWTLIIYIIAVILCSSLAYDNGHYIGEIYLTYHVNEIPVAGDYFYITFICAVVIDIGLEILVICLIKKLMNRYSVPTPYYDY